jgi:hypothetical protein
MVSRRKNESPPIEVRQFTRSEIDRGITKLRRRIDDVRGLDPNKVSFNDARVNNVISNIRETIREVFGPRSPEFEEHKYHEIRHTIFFQVDHWGERSYDDDPQREFAAGIPQTINMLEGLIARLEEKREDALPDVPPEIPLRSTVTGSRRVFIVHGRDDSAKETVARFLEKLDLQPIILHEQPNKGRTIIEKFETNADVDFAVILLTPDDAGYPADQPQQARPRARQNVILELGYFVGRIGRERVCALHKGGIEIPSDFEGVVYVSMDDPQGWRLSLAREIKAAGIEVDLNRAM